jgi:hypothetical protein
MSDWPGPKVVIRLSVDLASFEPEPHSSWGTRELTVAQASALRDGLTAAIEGHEPIELPGAVKGSG